MSTKGRLASALLPLALAACAATPSQPTHSFSEVRFGRPRAAPPPAVAEPQTPQAEAAPPSPDRAPAAATPPVLRPALKAPTEPAPVLPTSLAQASQRVSRFLDHDGFASEQRSEGDGLRIEATRMGPPSGLAAEAVCGLEAMHRPDIASTDVTLDLTPAPGGVQVQSTVRFVEIDTRLISGELARQTCRSRGLLEQGLRQAAAGG